eukprot:scaffold131677_cov48-Phaeocystis_antarctica.AAC.1
MQDNWSQLRVLIVVVAAATLLLEAADDVGAAVLAPDLVELLDVMADGALGESVAVGDLREMDEDVRATLVGRDEAEALLVPELGGALQHARGRRAGHATGAGLRVPLRLLAAAGDLLGALLAPAVVVLLDVRHRAALGEHGAVGDAGDVCEEVIATVVRLDEAKALLRVPTHRGAGVHGHHAATRDGMRRPAGREEAAVQAGDGAKHFRGTVGAITVVDPKGAVANLVGD